MSRPSSASGVAIPFAVAALGIAIFTGMDAMMKGLSIALGAYNAMLWRTALGLVMSGVLFLAVRGRWPDRATLLLHLLRGLAAAISVLCFFWGLARVPMAQGVALSFLAPLIALALAPIVLKERVGPRAVLAALVAFVGVLVILAGQRGGAAGPEARLGALAIIVAALFYAVNLVVARRQSLAAGPVEIAFAFNVVAILLYGVGAPWLAVIPPAEHWPPLLFSAVCSITSLMLLAWAYARAEAQALVSVEYSAFVWAAILGWLVFGERISAATLAGAALIVAACLWTARGGPAMSRVDPEASA